MDYDRNILVQNDNNKDQWKKYFEDLFDGEQRNILGDTTITPLDEYRESMRRINIRGE